MNHHQTHAFVLRTTDYGERDIIVTLLGRDTGRFSAIARSAKTSRRRFAGSLQPLRCLNASFTTRAQSDLATLTDAQVITDYPGIELDLEKIALASYATEIVRETCHEGDDASEVFDLLEDFFARLSTDAPTLPQSRALLARFELHLLAALGALPSLDGCARCGTSAQNLEKLMCSRLGEGLICPECRRLGEPLGVLFPEAFQLLQAYISDDTIPDALLNNDSARAQARRVIDTSLAQLIDRELKSRSMLTMLGLA